MYSVVPHNGNLGGQAGADALCVSQQPGRYAQAHAFLSVDETDEIRDMPARRFLAMNLSSEPPAI